VLTRFYEGAGREEDIDLIGDLAKTMFGRTFCALGDAAAMPTMAFIDKFRDEFEAYLKSTPPPANVPELALI
jgi:NADH-quinone oxidoreductase subunit F